MRSTILVLSFLGLAALARHALRAWFEVVRWGAESYAAGAMAEIRAVHGDVSGMQEARGSASDARRRRARSVGRGVVWSALLVAPAMTEQRALVYAPAALLWIPVALHARRPAR